MILTLDGQEARLTPVHHGARRAQGLCRARVERPGTVDDFLAERREEAGREEQEPADRKRGKTASAVLDASAVLAF